MVIGMKPVLSHYEEIIREMKHLQAKGNSLEEEDGVMLLPRCIGLSDGRQVFINEKIDKAIAAIARSTRSNEQAIKFAYSQADWMAIIVSATSRPPFLF
jgi:hypothetical protein